MFKSGYGKKRIMSFAIALMLAASELVLPVSAQEIQGAGDEEKLADADFFTEGSISQDSICSEADPDPEATPTPDPSADPTPAPSTEITVRILDDAAHGSALLTEAVHPTSGWGFQKTFTNNPKARAVITSAVRHGYGISSWNLYQVTSEGRTLVGNYAPNDLRQMNNSVIKIQTDYDIEAVWSSEPYTYKIDYNLTDGAYFSEEDREAGRVAEEFNILTPVTLCTPVRPGCIFAGWAADAAFSIPAESIPAGVVIDSDEDGKVPAYQLYPTWAPAAAKVIFTDAKNTKKGVVSLSFEPVPNAKRYEIQFSTDKGFSAKKTAVTNVSSPSGAALTNLIKKTYYIRVRAVVQDSTGELSEGAWSESIAVKVTKGVKEVKAKKGKIKLKKVEIANGEFHLVASSPKRLKSSDENYYLVTVNPFNNKVERMVAAVPKTKTIDVALPVRDQKKKTDLIQGKYGIAVKNGKKKNAYKLISKTDYVANPEDAADYTGAFPVPVSKKGLQGYNEGNVKHVFTNVILNSFFDVGKSSSNAYKYNGKTYYFNKGNINALAMQAANYNSKGIVFSAQFMLQWPGNSYKYLVAPGARTSGKSYYTLNGTEQKGRETWEALFSCMAEAMCNENAHIDNWILGNEVNVGNSASGWYWRGSMSNEEFMKNYASTYKIMYYAVRSHSKNARVYICMDHTFNTSDGDWGAKPFMALFNKKIRNYNKNIRWNLAYHAYPAELRKAATWRDSYTTSDESSRFVTPKNIKVLTEHVKKNYGKDCRIILSEQGFTAIGAGNSEDVQAAAVAYTYYKAEFNDMIDAVIFRAYTDADVEVQQGLAFGLSNRSKTWNMFKNMDSPKSLDYTKTYLSVIGIGSWADAIPGWDESKFSTMK
ncbi:MAG: hypothetical protein J5842_05060 [Lachnospiraceae bacterium]|nr:hypothetical protein [Lachnospiraceae bacterium]